MPYFKTLYVDIKPTLPSYVALTAPDFKTLYVDIKLMV